ncbi:MAG: DUF4965 domain-containing protein [Planctomycetia bacterium]|nr:DUF4965 domain-containing protein [Planctomycetia bacterium]
MTFFSMKRLFCAALALASCLVAAPNASAVDPVRAPAYPLVARDPYFSVWSNTDKLADSFPVHWTGAINALVSYARVDGVPIRLMGNPGEFDAIARAAKQTDVAVRATNTTYRFEDLGVSIELIFTNPILPDDLEVYARPTTYLTWRIQSLDQNDHEVKLYFDATAELCVNETKQEVVAKRATTDSLELLALGTASQETLVKSGDNMRIDWGYFYVAAEKGVAKSVIVDSAIAREGFIRRGAIPTQDDKRFPRPALDEWPCIALTIDCGIIKQKPTTRRIILAYDDEYSLTYLGEKLRPYWRKDGLEFLDMMDLASSQYDDIFQRCQKFDSDLYARATAAADEKYAQLCSIAYPQSNAAHKFVVMPNGKPALVSKECFSNGCAATVDILYPTSPIFMVYSTELLKGTTTPVLEYASSERWKFPFAPHDLGQYPLLEGQRYGGGEKTEENQMPIEESANMLIVLDVIARNEGNADYALEYWPTLEKWANYLLEYGLDPENQLCTDDFAGHLAHNANLSIKAIVALACYADLCERAGKDDVAKDFRAKAEEFAKEWVKLADNNDHYRLAFDRPDTWSMKYNIVWDKLLELNLFPAEVVNKELNYYQRVINPFGLPLDNRSDYTKLDWEVWTATLAPNLEGFNDIMNHVYPFMDRTAQRVPLTDWYFTNNAAQRGFQARAVVGGVFIKLLDPTLKK